MFRLISRASNRLIPAAVNGTRSSSMRLSHSLTTFTHNSRHLAFTAAVGVILSAFGISQLAAAEQSLTVEEEDELELLLEDESADPLDAAEWSSNEPNEPVYDPVALKYGRKYLKLSDPKSVASALKSRFQSGEHIIVEVYGRKCGACLMFSPIVDQLSKVLESVNPSTPGAVRRPITILMVESSDELGEGILTPEEELFTPVVKLFPALESIEPITYRGPSNARSLVEWLNSQLPVSERFDLNAALDSIKSSNPDTDRAVEDAYQIRWRTEASNSPSLLIAEKAPCAQHLNKLMKQHLTMGYRSFLNLSAEQQYKSHINELYENFHNCREKYESKLESYWNEIEELARKELSVIDRNRKLRNERKEEKLLEKQEKEKLGISGKSTTTANTAATAAAVAPAAAVGKEEKKQEKSAVEIKEVKKEKSEAATTLAKKISSFASDRHIV